MWSTPPHRKKNKKEFDDKKKKKIQTNKQTKTWGEINLWTQGGQWTLKKLSPPKTNALKHIQNDEDWRQYKKSFENREK